MADQPQPASVDPAAANPDSATTEDPVERLRSEYLEGLVRGDGRIARDAVRRARQSGMAAWQIALDIVAPALQSIGSDWAAGRIGVADEHLATTIALEDLAALAPSLGAAWVEPGRRRQPVRVGRLVAIAAPDGELHVVGARIVADFLEAAGWDVLFVGASTPGDALATFVGQRSPDVVALTTSLAEHLPATRATIQRLGSLPKPPTVLVGGAAFEGDPALARQLGADLFGRDAVDAIELLSRRFEVPAPTLRR